MNQRANIDINRIIQVAKKASDVILNIYERETQDWEVRTKVDSSPLTLADRESNDIICSELALLSPKFPVISEENKEIPYEERKKFKSFWLIDPLDGTKEFLKRNGEFTVNIALIDKQQPVMGVVYFPVFKKVYFAEKNKGAFSMDENGIITPLTAKSFRLSDKNLTIVASRSHINEETLSFMSRFDQAKTISMGSSMKLILVAEGKAHLYPRLGPTMEWDTAAAQIIVEEAGGKVKDFYTGENMKYNKESLLNKHFIVEGCVSDS